MKRWCDQGLLAIVKTAGGHRRISVPEALRFVREQNLSVVEPHLLGMTASDDRKSRRTEGCVERLAESLIADNEQASRAIIFDLFLAGQSLSQIFDEVIAVAFQQIGEKWECHEVEIWQERCSCQIALRILHELRGKQVPPQTESDRDGGHDRRRLLLTAGDDGRDRAAFDRMGRAAIGFVDSVRLDDQRLDVAKTGTVLVERFVHHRRSHLRLGIQPIC